MEDQEIKRWLPLINRDVSRHASSVSRQQKQDLKQECALELIRSEQKINAALDRGEGCAVNLVSKIIRTTVIDWFRRSGRQPQQDSLSDPKIFRKAEKIQAAEDHRNAYHERVGKAADRLPPDQKIVIDLTMTEGLTAEEIAARLGWTRRQVERMKAAAIKRLRRILTR